MMQWLLQLLWSSSRGGSNNLMITYHQVVLVLGKMYNVHMAWYA